MDQNKHLNLYPTEIFERWTYILAFEYHTTTQIF